MHVAVNLPNTEGAASPNAGQVEKKAGDSTRVDDAVKPQNSENVLKALADYLADDMMACNREIVARMQSDVPLDQGNIASSCRAWWLLRLFGHERVFILDGGLPAWRATEGEIEQGAPSPIVAAHYIPRLTTGLLKGLGDMLALCSSDTDDVILDARSSGRFTGTAPEPRAGLSSGHMPGARNIPFGELLDADKHFLPKASLKARFEKAGAASLQTPLIATCGSIYILAGKKAGAAFGTYAPTLGMITGTLTILPFGITQFGSQLLHPHVIWDAVALAALSSAFPYSLEMYALRRLPTKTFSVLTSGEPAVGAIMGMFLLGEHLPLPDWLGIAAIVTASLGTTLMNRRKAI